MRLFGTLEAGETEMVCAIAGTEGEILERVVIPTRTPAETMPEVIDFFEGKGLAAVGIGCFGPVYVDKRSPACGTILSTPDPAWQGYPMAHTIRDALDVPVGFDTDANAAALGEFVWGCTHDVGSSIYIAVGAAIGTGVIIHGKPLHGMLHPQGGHIQVIRSPDDPMPRGVCPCHKNCLEGYANSAAIARRWGRRAEELADREEVWQLEAYYLGQAIASYVMLLSPERVVLGGSIMRQEKLLPLVRDAVRSQINGYIQAPALDDLTTYIVPASLEGRQGLLGGLHLAMEAFFIHGGKL